MGRIMKDIRTRSEIAVIVDKFYAKIRQDQLLGSIFNRHIEETQWPAHIEKETDFWESNLFGTAGFRGNPSTKHTQVDQGLGHTMSEHHFQQWLGLWFETVDELFSGEVAEKAKAAAARMAQIQLITVRSRRPTEN